jgi:outer membrane protein
MSTGIVKVKDTKTSNKLGMEGLLHPDHAIRYLNSMEVMQASERGKIVAGELEEKRIAFTKEITDKREALQKSAQQYQDQKLTMSESAREQKEKQLLRDQRELEALTQERDQDFQIAMRKATDQLLQEVEKVVAKIAKEEGWDAVIDCLTGRVLYAAHEVEISDKVISAWNFEHTHEQKTSKA